MKTTAKKTSTKRRKVWVNFYEDGSNDGCAFETKTDALENASTAYRVGQVKFVETRLGDVVLSREEVDAISKLLAHAAGVLADGLSEQARYPVRDALALLRGGR